ncbi:hypothetical protein NL676_030898 [Syzygium grande]|nr:hypothetical protein NL676_030898 [Syzygium grande]
MAPFLKVKQKGKVSRILVRRPNSADSFAMTVPTTSPLHTVASSLQALDFFIDGRKERIEMETDSLQMVKMLQQHIQVNRKWKHSFGKLTSGWPNSPT